VLSCAAMHASCCHDPQNALVEEGCAILLPCKLAAVVIHRMLWCKEGCAIPALPCKLAAVVIHRMGGRRLCYPCAAMQACCCDSNALVARKVCYRMPQLLS
jgi:hypothetical protein